MKINALCQFQSCLLYECGSTTACFKAITQYNEIQLCPGQIRLWSFGLLCCGWGFGVGVLDFGPETSFGDGESRILQLYGILYS